jgi:hypothetical protein
VCIGVAEERYGGHLISISISKGHSLCFDPPREYQNKVGVPLLK